MLQPPTIRGKTLCLMVVRRLIINSYFMCCNISVLSGGISMKLAKNTAFNMWVGVAEKVKDLAMWNALTAEGYPSTYAWCPSGRGIHFDGMVSTLTCLSKTYHYLHTLDPRYNTVIGLCCPYRIITRTALYWNEQQNTLVSLSCHIIISLNDYWSCTACCRCYRLRYQISAAAAPYTALNRSPVQCNVKAARVFTMFMHLLIYLPPLYPSRLTRLLRFITLILLLNRVY